MDLKTKQGYNMKLTAGRLRHLIREVESDTEGEGEALSKIPGFLVTGAVDEFIAQIRQYIKRHIQDTNDSDVTSRESLQQAEEILMELSDETNDLVKEKLYTFLQRT